MSSEISRAESELRLNNPRRIVPHRIVCRAELCRAELCRAEYTRPSKF